MYFNQKSILAADYLRLSREDGDKLESDSIRNQRSLINDFVKQHPDITLAHCYTFFHSFPNFFLTCFFVLHNEIHLLRLSSSVHFPVKLIFTATP